MSKNSNLLSPIIVVGIAPLLCLVVVYGLARLILGDLVEAVGWNAIAAFSVAGFAITMGTIGHHLRVSEMRHLAFMGYGMLTISVVMALANSASRGSTGLTATVRSIVVVLEIGAILLAGAATLLAAIRYIILYRQNIRR